MKEFKYVVTDNEGIHARPAGELVKLVKGFESTISIEKEGKKVDCRKLLALMGLGVKKHEEVAIYEVNLRIPNVCRIAGATKQRSNS